MSYKREYDDKRVSPEQAVGIVQSGNWVDYGHFACAPTFLDPSLANRARKVVVEVNSSVPCCYGGYSESIHVSEVDYIVESDNKPLISPPTLPVSEQETRIAKLIMNEIHDGSVIQLGIGAMPSAVGTMIAQSDLKELGVHTEMLCDAFVDMYETGRVTDKIKKSRYRKEGLYLCIGKSETL